MSTLVLRIRYGEGSRAEMVEARVDGEIDRGLGVDGVKSATISRG